MLQQRDAMMIAKILVSFAQINLALPSMMSGFEWKFPPLYTEFLKHVGIVELNLLPLLGIQCVVDMDYRYSVLLALSIPILVGVVCWLGLCLSRRRVVAAVSRLTAVQRRDELSQLFDLSDFDNSGELNVAEIRHLIELVTRGASLRGGHMRNATSCRRTPDLGLHGKQ